MSDDEAAAMCAAVREECASICERMVVGGRAWTVGQAAAAEALFAAASQIRGRVHDEYAASLTGSRVCIGCGGKGYVNVRGRGRPGGWVRRSCFKCFGYERRRALWEQVPRHT